MNIKELETKYFKVLTTGDQRKIIEATIELVTRMEDVKEGRALELICSDFLSGYPHRVSKVPKKGD